MLELLIKNKLKELFDIFESKIEKGNVEDAVTFLVKNIVMDFDGFIIDVYSEDYKKFNILIDNGHVSFSKEVQIYGDFDGHRYDHKLDFEIAYMLLRNMFE